MYDHVGLKVKNLEASVRFYKAALAALGFGLCSQDAASAGFGPPDQPALWLLKGNPTGSAHIALKAESRAAVDSFYKTAIEGGGRDNGKPGIRADYAPNYYAAFIIDPDGNNLEAVCLS